MLNSCFAGKMGNVDLAFRLLVQFDFMHPLGELLILFKGLPCYIYDIKSSTFLAIPCGIKCYTTLGVVCTLS
jgi:hypothetical protein